MRLKKDEIAYIKNTISFFDPKATVYLFGSRVDDHLKGGDIDILILSKIINLNIKRQIRIKLYDKLGEQKIDIVIAKGRQKPFIKLALQNSVVL
jgi:uncharacterized protein